MLCIRRIRFSAPFCLNPLINHQQIIMKRKPPKLTPEQKAQILGDPQPGSMEFLINRQMRSLKAFLRSGNQSASAPREAGRPRRGHRQ